jgi:hypothetical protein
MIKLRLQRVRNAATQLQSMFCAAAGKRHMIITGVIITVAKRRGNKIPRCEICATVLQWLYAEAVCSQRPCWRRARTPKEPHSRFVHTKKRKGEVPNDNDLTEFLMGWIRVHIFFLDISLCFHVHRAACSPQVRGQQESDRATASRRPWTILLVR